MDGRNFEQARYAGMRWNTPLSEEHAARLLERLEIGRRHSVIDLGCGWGELLLRAVSDRDRSGTAVGVDTDADLLQRGRAAAAARGLDDRVTFLHGRAEERREPADRVLCVGAAHA
jgi:cyclopropane fatty-acyl-phospholipid synthase-like methyltransferase